MPQNDLRALSAFLAVAEERSFTPAAKRLGVSPSAMSHACECRALNRVSGLRNKPAGRVRLLVPRLAATAVLAPKLGKFARDYPDILLDVTTGDTRMDIAAAGFDAGTHFGESPRDLLRPLRL